MSDKSLGAASVLKHLTPSKTASSLLKGDKVGIRMDHCNGRDRGQSETPYPVAAGVRCLEKVEKIASQSCKQGKISSARQKGGVMIQLAFLEWRGHADALVSDSEQITCFSILEERQRRQDGDLSNNQPRP